MDVFKNKLAKSRHSFLHGTLQKNNPVAILRGHRDVLEGLFRLIEEPQYDEFCEKRYINKKSVPFVVWPRLCRWPDAMTNPIVFPTPKDINVNMMPILLGWDGLSSSLPPGLQQYAHFINQHCNTSCWTLDEHGKYKRRTAYLTIHEGFVPVGQTQRRPGLHIERPGAVKCCGEWYDTSNEKYMGIAWGTGCWHEDGLPENGIYMASTLSETCAVWPVLIEHPEEITDKHGGLESIRHILGEPYKLKANEMCWLTDRTPHESLPIQAPTSDPNAKYVYRQFFRLVVGPISVWYSRHNTENPLGIQPDCPISDEDKFCD